MLGELDGQGAAAARSEFVQIRFYRGRIVEAIEALTVAAQFADRLWSAQGKHGQQGDASLRQSINLAEILRITQHAAGSTVVLQDQGTTAQLLQGGLQFALGQVHDRVARCFLVASGDKTVECQRIGVGGDFLFLHQDAQDAGLDLGERR